MRFIRFEQLLKSKYRKMLLYILLCLQVLLSIHATPMEKISLGKSEAKFYVPNAYSETKLDDLRSTIQRYAAYNHWANKQMADWLRTASEGALHKRIESSFSTIDETIFHIWNAEYLWLQTVKGEEANNYPSIDFKGNTDEMLDAWLRASEDFCKHVQSMSPSVLQSTRPKSQSDGHLRIVDMIHHCMNHSTYHRGQLITMGRQAGLENPPRTDFIYYVSLPNE